MDTRTGEIGSLDDLLAKAKRPEDVRPLTDAEHAQLAPMNRQERRKWAREQRKAASKARAAGRRKADRIRPELKPYLGSRLREVPRALWPVQVREMGAPPLRVWLSRGFLVQLYYDRRTSHRRLTVSRTEYDEAGWLDEITWDQLQSLKEQAGFGFAWAAEVYPPDDQVVNVAAMRHLWILSEAPAFAWTPANV